MKRQMMRGNFGEGKRQLGENKERGITILGLGREEDKSDVWNLGLWRERRSQKGETTMVNQRKKK